MGEVSAVFEDEGEEGVAGFHDGHECGGVCLCAGVWLDIGVFAVEELFCSVAGELFYGVVVCASAVVASSWVALGVFVGHAGACGGGDGGGGVIFGGDEFDGVLLAGAFLGDDVGDLGIGCGDGFDDCLVD